MLVALRIPVLRHHINEMHGDEVAGRINATKARAPSQSSWGNLVSGRLSCDG